MPNFDIAAIPLINFLSRYFDRKTIKSTLVLQSNVMLFETSLFIIAGF